MAIISNGVATWKVDFGDKKSEWLNKPGELSEGDYQHLFNTGYLRVAMQEGETADTRLELREVAKALEAEREQSMS